MAAQPATVELTLEIPKIDNDDEVVEEPGEKQEETAAFVPTLPDLPTSVDLQDAFRQEIDYASLVPRAKMEGADLVNIPKTIRYGSGDFGKGMKNLFDLSQLDRIPEAMFQPAPVIPDRLKRLGTDAKVNVRFIVNTRGEVISPIVVSSDQPDFNELALATVIKWKFKPGKREGKAVNTRMQQMMVFRFDMPEA